MHAYRLNRLTSSLLLTGLMVSSAGALAQATAQSTASNDRSTTTSQATTSQTATSAMGNAALTAKVKAGLVADERTKAFDTNVDTDGNGQVTLQGTAPTKEAKMAAAEVARKTSGVTSVRNHLVVSTDRTSNPQTLSAKTQDVSQDSWMTTKVKAALADDKRVSASDVHVETSSGTVTLSGTVNSSTERQAAIERARQVKGVTKVDATGLMVNGQGSTMSR